jgi:hypothetical protein
MSEYEYYERSEAPPRRRVSFSLGGLSKQIRGQKRPRRLTTPIGLNKANEAGVDAFLKPLRTAVRPLGRPQSRFVCPEERALDKLVRLITMEEFSSIRKDEETTQAIGRASVEGLGASLPTHRNQRAPWSRLRGFDAVLSSPAQLGVSKHTRLRYFATRRYSTDAG